MFQTDCNWLGKLYGEYSLRGCNAMQFTESPMFQRNLTCPSSGSKHKPSKKPTEVGLSLTLWMKRVCSSETGSSSNYMMLTARKVMCSSKPYGSNLRKWDVYIPQTQEVNISTAVILPVF
jgi:hypothetical protein